MDFGQLMFGIMMHDAIDIIHQSSLQRPSVESINQARQYITNELQLPGYFSLRFISAVQTAMITKNTTSPTIKDICEAWTAQGCECTGLFGQKLHFEACEYVLSVFQESPSCELIQSVCSFHIQEHHFPSREQYNLMIMNENAMDRDSSAYCESKKMHVPVSNLDRLLPVQNDQERACSICQEDIRQGKMMFQLPCGDCFHASNCLGNNQSILTWLNKCKRCPNCNQEIHL
jgi:hypothetical protein